MQLNKAYIKQGNKSQPNLRDICGLRKLFPTVALYFLTFVDGEKYARHIELRRSRRDIGPRTLAHATTSTCKSASRHGRRFSAVASQRHALPSPIKSTVN